MWNVNFGQKILQKFLSSAEFCCGMFGLFECLSDNLSDKIRKFSFCTCFIFTRFLICPPGSLSVFGRATAPLGSNAAACLGEWWTGSEVKQNIGLHNPPTFYRLVLELCDPLLPFFVHLLLCPLQVAFPHSHGLIVINHNAILSSAASPGRCSWQNDNMAERERCGHLGALNNKCKGWRRPCSVLWLDQTRVSLSRCCKQSKGHAVRG